MLMKTVLTTTYYGPFFHPHNDYCNNYRFKAQKLHTILSLRHYKLSKKRYLLPLPWFRHSCWKWRWFLRAESILLLQNESDLTRLNIYQIQTWNWISEHFLHPWRMYTKSSKVSLVKICWINCRTFQVKDGGFLAISSFSRSSPLWGRGCHDSAKGALCFVPSRKSL